MLIRATIVFVLISGLGGCASARTSVARPPVASEQVLFVRLEPGQPAPWYFLPVRAWQVTDPALQERPDTEIARHYATPAGALGANRLAVSRAGMRQAPVITVVAYYADPELSHRDSAAAVERARTRPGWGGGITSTLDQDPNAGADASSIYRRVAADAVAQYRIVERSRGSALDLCVQAGLVAAAYLQAQNESQYREWKGVERRNCRIAGVP